MAAADWPSTLPAAPRHAGYAQREQSAVIRSPMGYGPAKMRRRTTAAIEPINVTFALTDAQKSDLDTFYVTTLESGTLAFNWDDPLRNAGAGTNLKEFRFTSPVQWSSRGPNIWLAVLNLEMLP